ncbi:MBL fold metallo-hydrolase [Methanococcoides burtonii]|uniref:Metallo-beta-lactamase domain-containing protein n=1 Tax=Methanococcoides burtonii (strain DSM 6242 / NBRC 107633 / OCM 468 / ACE-M) TaxID=259564 RepID=Q12WJ4_METBU|nr:MBL fold metallo-hydrolase [Methanococcoides burtonii]ABE52182.1 Hypothetical protein Mbur_1261 [Methanococcoides burtonii DSM 6242]
MDREKEYRVVDAVLISHTHGDHAQYIHILRTDIPIYCTKGTKTILQCLLYLGTGDNDFIDACEAYTFYNRNDQLLRVDRRKEEYIHPRNYTIMMPGEIGTDEVIAFHSEVCGNFKSAL